MPNPVDAVVELRINNAWVDITSDCRIEDAGGGLTINQGVPAEGSVADPAQIQLAVNNTGGKYTSRNPTGPYYGYLDRNVGIRAGVRQSVCFLDTAGDAGAGYGGSASTVDSAGLSITGDIDLRMEYGGNPFDATLGKHNGSQNGLCSYRMRVSGSAASNFTGTLVLDWSTTGTTFDKFAASTLPVPYRDGIMAVRATLDVDNGAGGWTATFYYADDMASTWVQLGDPVTGSGVTSIADTTANVYIAGRIDQSGNQDSNVRKAQIRQGIGGTIRANPDFTAQANGATGFSDGTNSWAINSPAKITNVARRFAGEVAEFPSRWNKPGTDVWVPLVGAGVLRRLNRGRLIRSPLTWYLSRYAKTSPSIVTGYWPMEDQPGSTVFATAGPGPDATFIGTPVLAAVDPDTPNSDPIPTFNAAGATFTPVNPTAGTAFTVGVMVNIPDAGTTNGAELFRASTAGSCATWVVTWETGGVLRLVVAAIDGTVLLNVSADFDLGPGNAIAGNTGYITLEVAQNGGGVDYALNVNPSAIGGPSGTIATSSVTAVTALTVGAARNITGDVGIGHVFLGNTKTALFTSDFVAAFHAWDGEGAVQRLRRLAGTDQGLSLEAVIGRELLPANWMGLQQAGTALDLMRETEKADLGILHDHPTRIGLRYIPRAAMYSAIDPANAPLVLDYTATNPLTDPLAPTDDDANIRNDVTAARTNGSSSRQVDLTSPLNAQDYPLGIGPYDFSDTYNVQTDAQIYHLAGWLLMTGTVDETRYPQLAVDLIKNPSLVDAVNAIRPGSRITLTHMPAWMPPGNVELTVLGWTESIGTHTRTIIFNCEPANPFRVFALNSATYGRLDSSTTTANEVIDTTETGIDYTGDTWVTTAANPSDFPFDITFGGEVATVTSAIAGTFTVTRSVNGVVKSHPIGTPIGLAYPVHLAL